jgi:CHASE2 domain-containing sensor protein
VLIIIGGLLNIFWGISHLFPINSVVNSFYNISIDNKRILIMEWINEGFALIFIGLLVTMATVVNSENTKTLQLIYILSSIMLFSMATLSLFTGFKIDLIPFKMCPIVFSVSGILILQGVFRK